MQAMLNSRAEVTGPPTSRRSPDVRSGPLHRHYEHQQCLAVLDGASGYGSVLVGMRDPTRADQVRHRLRSVQGRSVLFELLTPGVD